MSYLFLILQFCLNQVPGATDFYSYTKGTQRCMYINIPLRQTDMPLCLPKPAKNSLVNFQWNLVNHFIYHNDNKIELSMQACSQFIASTHYDIRTICRQQRMHNGQQQLHLQASFGIGAGKLTQQLASPSL